MRTVPSDITIAPVPDDFTAPITDDGRTLRAGVTINGEKYEIGLRPARTDDQIGEAREQLREGIWQLREFARLDRPDLMAYAHKQRHTLRR